MRPGRADEGWCAATQEPQHPLAPLQGRALGSYTLEVFLGPSNRYGARYFRLHLRDKEDRLSREPILWGLHHSGPQPGFNWVEVGAYPGRAVFGGGVALELAKDELEEGLFQALGEVIPPGGHLMVEYESSPWRETERGLALGFPPAATPLGRLMVMAGCGASFKDWPIAEGWSEGPRKLQGNKALSPDHAREGARHLARELRAYLEQPANIQHPELEAAARRRAQEVLAWLRAEFKELGEDSAV